MSIFNNLFGTKEKKLSKVEYWKKWEFFELLDDLHAAFNLLTESEADTKEKQNFKTVLEDKIDDIEGGNKTDLTEFWNWFAPGGQWNVIMGQKDEGLRERIFTRTDRWKKASR